MAWFAEEVHNKERLGLGVGRAFVLEHSVWGGTLGEQLLIAYVGLDQRISSVLLEILQRGSFMPEIPGFADVEEAAKRIAPHSARTPLLENCALNEHLQARILIKPECLQRVGAFKFRGAYNAISRVDAAAFPGGVVTCSSGNHAQGVAEAARIMGFKAAIVMPSDAPKIKVRGVKRAGGEVIAYDRKNESRETIAKRIADERQAAFIPPFDDPKVIAGQGTVGLELMSDADALGAVPDAVLVPASGGGLISGVAIAVKHFSPGTEVNSVEPSGFDDLARSLKAGKHEHNEPGHASICDALLVPTPGKLTFEICREFLAGGLVVSDEAALSAMRYAFETLKLVVEPSGAIALAALLDGAFPVKGRTVAVVLSGGNVDPDMFATAIA